MFLRIVALLGCIYVCVGAPAKDEPIPILSQESEIEPDGKFHYSFESGDGTKVSEHGEQKVIDPEHSAESVEGNFEYSAPDGKKVAIHYVADENGYQPTGDVLPVAPPIPEAIAKALKYIEEHSTTKEEVP